MFKAQKKLENAFSYKDCISKELTSVAVYKFQCGLCNKSYYGGYVRNLNVRNQEDMRTSPWTKKKVTLKGGAVSELFLLCNHRASFESFSALNKENKKFV